MNLSAQLPSEKQALRLKRFLIASTTYAVGLTLLGLCSAMGLFPTTSLAIVAAAFVVLNAGLFAVFHSGLNLRFEEPSLTQLQVCFGVALIALILIVGEQVHFVAIPFYSSLFIFAMLKLGPRQLVRLEVFVLATYAAAVMVRVQLYPAIDLRIEGINAALVVVSSIWFAMAASYISGMRARLRQSMLAIESLAMRDAMTDTWNRRHIDTLLLAEMQRRERADTALCIGIIDVDHFKSINDQFGHLVGDTVLRDVAQAMKAQLRAVDSIGRFGGEEFLIVLPATSVSAARLCAERLLQAVAGLTVLGEAAGRITISVGLAACEAGESAEALLTRADAALYRAKREGRNRIAVGTPTDAAEGLARRIQYHRPAPVAQLVRGADHEHHHADTDADQRLRSSG